MCSSYMKVFSNTVLEKCLLTIAFVWSKTTLNIGGVGGQGRSNIIVHNKGKFFYYVPDTIN